MKMTKFLGAAAVVACCGVIAPVSAAIVQVQYTGTVSSGYDITGVFGTANSFLTGAAYTANYTFETANGYTYNSPNQNYAYGGSAYPTLSPSLGSTVTINGNTVSIAGNYFGEIYGIHLDYFGQTYHAAQDYVSSGSGYTNNYSYNTIYNFSNTIPASITGPFSYAVTGGDYANGYVQITDYNYSSGTVAYANAYLTPDHVTIGAPIPEPETYAMLLAGLGLLGFAARRRKLKLAA